MSEQPSRSAPVSTARSGPNPSKIDDSPARQGLDIYIVILALPWIVVALLIALAIFGKPSGPPCTVGCG